MPEAAVGVLGATSLVGVELLPLLTETRFRVTAFTRQQVQGAVYGVDWQRLSCEPEILSSDVAQNIPLWICVAPIWVLPEYFSMLEAYGVRKVVALSSTSCFTKNVSVEPDEQIVVKQLTDGEIRLQAWAKQHSVKWVVLRPTLIYGKGRDKNIAETARLIRHFGFFPLFGQANGLRQPIHAEDVAAACIGALNSSVAVNRAYNISGAETMTYRDMVRQVFVALKRPVRLMTIPIWVFQLGVTVLRQFPRYRHWTVAMAERMNEDLVFDHQEATQDFGFQPRGFALSGEDVAV